MSLSKLGFVPTSIAVIAALFVLAGCSGASSPEAVPPTQPTPEASAVSETTPPSTATVAPTPDEPATAEATADALVTEGIVAARFQADNGARYLVLAPADADRPSLEYLMESAELRALKSPEDLLTLPGHYPLVNLLWTVDVSEAEYDTCPPLAQYPYCADGAPTPTSR